jgi:hypothetical protein
MNREIELLNFIRIYLIVLQKDIIIVKENIEKVFFTTEMSFKYNLWHNFACNFRDPTFYKLLCKQRNIDKVDKLKNILTNICLVVQTIRNKSNY